MIELIILNLFFLIIYFAKQYLDKHEDSDLAIIIVISLVFFNLWLEQYYATLSDLFSTFKPLLNTLLIIIIISYLLLEKQRRKEIKEKNETKKYFSKYLSPKIVEQILKQKSLLKNQRTTATILFTDIRGFTRMAEREKPEKIISILNKHFDIISDTILKYDGTILKYIGDAVLAAFNIPLKQEEYELRAVKCAIEIQKKMKKIGVPLGIGIVTGEVIEGNIGSKHYMDYTIIGDSVNTASRLNGIAKKGEIIIDENTAKKIKGKIKISKKLKAKVKGKQKEVSYYKVKL